MKYETIKGKMTAIISVSLLALTLLFAISITPLLHAQEKVTAEEARAIAKEA
jgi:hypothetical protein